MTIDQALALITEHDAFQLLARVPEELFDRGAAEGEVKRGLIIDLETMGTNYQKDAIIEIGMVGFEYAPAEGRIVKVDSTYNELNDPGKKIPKDIVAITGITNDDVKGKAIDWQQVAAMLEPADIIICHNSAFDRKFMEKQTPDEIREIVETKAFGCTFNDINWKGFGIESSKLDYINWKLGYFYGSHRALTDCWATLNVLDSTNKPLVCCLPMQTRWNI